MSSSAPDMQQLLQAWVASTKGTKVPVPRTDVLRRRVKTIRRHAASLVLGVTNVIPADEDLAMLSLLSVDLVSVSEPSASTLRSAVAAGEAVASFSWADDEFDEKKEMLARFAFLAWRHSRSLGSVASSQEWLETYDSLSEGDFVLWDGLAPFQSGSVFESLAEDAEQLFLACSFLRRQRDVSPAKALANATDLYRLLQRKALGRDRFEERRYFLCESASIAAVINRLLGKRDECSSWLAKAAQACSGMVDEVLRNTQCEFTRLSLRYGFKDFDGLLASVESLEEECNANGFKALALRSRYLKAVVRKDLGDCSGALWELERLKVETCGSERLRPWILMILGEVRARLGQPQESIQYVRDAESTAAAQDQVVLLANLRIILAEILRDQGLIGPAIEKFREGIAALGSLGLVTTVAYARIILSESLLAMNRPEEAELEVLAALPTIEEQQMVPEGLSAIALLRESIRRRKTDRNALRELREHLQGKL